MPWCYSVCLSSSLTSTMPEERQAVLVTQCLGLCAAHKWQSDHCLLLWLLHSSYSHCAVAGCWVQTCTIKLASSPCPLAVSRPCPSCHLPISHDKHQHLAWFPATSAEHEPLLLCGPTVREHVPGSWFLPLTSWWQARIYLLCSQNRKICWLPSAINSNLVQTEALIMATHSRLELMIVTGHLIVFYVLSRCLH